MNAFEYTDISHPYYMRPNAAPWASVAPTIVFRGRRPWLVIGSPGSGAGYGAAFLYRRDSGSGGWTEQSRLAAYNSIAGDRFGEAEPVNDNGTLYGIN